MEEKVLQLIVPYTETCIRCELLATKRDGRGNMKGRYCALGVNLAKVDIRERRSVACPLKVITQEVQK